MAIFNSLTIAHSAIFDLNGKTITLYGNFANSATFTHSNGAVVFAGSTTAIISGSSTFYDFTCTTAGKQITFTSGTTQIIAGTLTLTGTSSGRIKLRSSSSGVVWNINPQGSRIVTYVDVKDSTNLNASNIDTTYSFNSGNNTKWNLMNTIYL